MTSNDPVHRTWVLIRGTDEEITIDLWRDGETVRIAGGDDDGDGDDRGQQAVDQYLATYQTVGYRLKYAYLVNDLPEDDEDRTENGLPDDRPDACPECGIEKFDFDPNHTNGLRMGPAWLCTGCKWGAWSYADGVA